ncbi:hypothetical protein [Streptomyces montanisoli]|uniref:Secreted protein n=1 Tax=Streptomyces montanisoli TaxID=2798581 RepID=A0A940MC30_9ACTN|nr:hypothetical protein [Streptomyces montanisoli]MBP0458252.1 hypothetical protein [Streptomyces montanisoli]
MKTWHGVRAYRAAGAAAAAVALAVSLTACGGDGGQGKDGGGHTPAAGSSASPPQAQKSASGEGSTSSAPPQVIAKASSGTFQFAVNSAKRDKGGFLTIAGTITNLTGQVQIAPTAWNGDESQVNKNGSSLAAMTLVDTAQKKRYYVLRDTGGHALTTVDIPNFQPNAVIPFFAQFPAPPSSTSKVEMDFPGLPPATIAIS